MTSRRKLEEEIAQTKDSAIRKQLQELFDKREQRRDKKIKDAKEIGAALLDEIFHGEAVSPRVGAVIWIVWISLVAIILIFIFSLLILECVSY